MVARQDLGKKKADFSQGGGTMATHGVWASLDKQAEDETTRPRGTRARHAGATELAEKLETLS